MAKMTGDVKAANKAAQKIRDSAYHARQKEYRLAREQVEQRIEASPEAQAVLAARAEMEAGIEARNLAQKAIAEQIAALQARMLEVGKEGEVPINAARAARDIAWAAKEELSKAELAKVSAAFSDISEVDYVGAWEIPAQVQGLMAEAAELARKSYKEAG